MAKSRVTLKPFNSPHHPTKKWVVYWPALEPGKRNSRRFTGKTEAEDFRLKKEIELANYGRKTASLKEKHIEEAVWAIEQLDGRGVTVREVVMDFLKKQEHSKKSIRIDVAVFDFLDTKATAKKSKRYLQDLRQRCNRFAQDFGDWTMADIDLATIEHWLVKLKVKPVTQNNFRRVLSVFFNWGEKRGYCASNPVDHVEKVKESAERVEIFTPRQLRVILDAAPKETIPFLVIGAFAGMRPAEIGRLQWEDVDFANRRIDVRASVSKTAQNRYVPMNDSLIKWLTPTKAAGKIAPQRVMKMVTKFRSHLEKEHGVKWANDVLRHSYASYTYAQCDDAGKVAAWLGNSVTVMLKHYRERVTKEEAAAWFGVLPLNRQDTIKAHE